MPGAFSSQAEPQHWPLVCVRACVRRVRVACAVLCVCCVVCARARVCHGACHRTHPSHTTRKSNALGARSTGSTTASTAGMIAAASESGVRVDASDVARAKMCVWEAGEELQIAPLHFDLSCVEHTQSFILSVAVAGLRTRDIHSLESDPSAACRRVPKAEFVAELKRVVA